MSFTQDSEAPDDFHFWTGVSVIAGALRRRVWIDMRKFQWTPNFYIILVAPPGIATKSTSMRSGLRLLEQVEGIHFGPQAITWQALTDALVEAIEHVRLVNDAGDDIMLPMSCLSIAVSELGTFLKIDDSGLIDMLVDLWDGQLSQWRRRTRATGDIEIRNPWINVIGCTTPSWIKTHFPDNLIGGGLTSRVMFVYGDTKRELIAYPDEIIPDADYFRMEQALIDDLREISQLCGPYSVEEEARVWGRAWYRNHWKGARPVHLASDRYEGYVARKQTHMHKLAIILSAARSDNRIITKEHLMEAEAILSTTEPYMLKVFESIGIVSEAKHVKEIVSFVRAYDWLSSDAAWRCVANLMSYKEFEEALKAAVRGGYLTVEIRNGQRGVKLPEGAAANPQ